MLLLIRHKELIRSFIKRELISRYRGSYMGMLWSFLNPLFLLVIYTVVFSTIFKVRVRGSSNPALYGVYLLCGLVPWYAFAETIGQSANLVTRHVNLVKKTVFPLEILSIVSTLTGLIHSFFSVGILTAAILVLQEGLHPTVIFLPLVMVAQLLFTVGLSWFLASLGVFIRDVAEIMRLLLMPWMFLTPIFYPVDMIPARLRIIIFINPMAVIVTSYRRVMLDGLMPEWGALIAVILLGCGFAVLGYLWFMKTKKAFADVI